MSVARRSLDAFASTFNLDEGAVVRLQGTGVEVIFRAAIDVLPRSAVVQHEARPGRMYAFPEDWQLERIIGRVDDLDRDWQVVDVELGVP